MNPGPAMSTDAMPSVVRNCSAIAVARSRGGTPTFLVSVSATLVA